MSIIWTTTPHSQFPIQFVVLAMLASLWRNSKLSGRISCAKHTEREAGRECQTNQTNRLFADGRRRNPAIHQFCPPSFLPFSRPERNESAHVRRARDEREPAATHAENSCEKLESGQRAIDPRTERIFGAESAVMETKSRIWRIALGLS